jgi:hypothetical protein
MDEEKKRREFLEQWAQAKSNREAFKKGFTGSGLSEAKKSMITFFDSFKDPKKDKTQKSGS